MTPREATIESMEQIQMALIAIALVLSAVFLPMAFFGGSTGVIYRQFSVTIVSSMVLSVFVALALSPAMAANLLRRQQATVEQTWLDRRAPGVAHRSNRAGQVQRRLRSLPRLVSSAASAAWSPANGCARALRRRRRRCSMLLFLRLPTGFLPPEDQGAARSSSGCRPARPMARTLASAAGRSRIFPRAREEQRQGHLHRRRRRPGRGGPEHRPGVHRLRRGTSARAAEQRRRDHPARHRRVPRPARRAVLRARTRRDPRPRPIERLHDGAARTPAA